MEAERRKQLLIVALALVGAGAIYWAWSMRTSTTPAASSSPRGPLAGAGKAGPSAAEAPEVHLNALEAERPKPGLSGRNLFSFRVKPAPAPPALAPRPAASLPAEARAATPVPTGPPPPPQITYKFIGIVEASAPSAKIAVLSDGRNVFQGREGDIIEGRFRILRIGVESIEMAYLDGRGRQTIRLTGS